jgi:hypothetical protein
MTIFWIIIATILTISVIFAAINLWRLLISVKKYQLKEHKYTLLFGKIHLKHAISLYVIAMGAYTIGTVMIALFLLNS